MLGEAGLESLRLRKELLVLKSDTDRLRLASDLRRLGAPEFWLDEASKTARRHPLLTAALGGGVGLLAIQTLRRPGTATGWLRQLVTLGSAALPLWKMFKASRRGE